MANSNIKLIGLDLDGTLLNHKKQVTSATKEAIRQAIAAGIYVVPVTGRPFVGLEFAEGLFDIEGLTYAITSNGASIYRLKTKECFNRDWLSVQKTREVLKCIEAYPLVPDCFIEGEGHMASSNKEQIRKLPMTKVLQNYVLHSRVFVDDLADYVLKMGVGAEKVTINFFADRGNGGLLYADEVRSALEKVEGVTVVSGAPHNLEVNKKGVSKSSGLRKLGALLGIQMKEMMVCGDSENDRAMIEDAGIGVAMGNAGVRIKEIADCITDSNEEDGVAHAIMKLLSDEMTNIL